MVPVAMLLLDHNLPHQLQDLLTTYGLECETAASRGWERLRNGELVAAAHAAGFDTIFTRDSKFAESASIRSPFIRLEEFLFGGWVRFSRGCRPPQM